MDELEAFADKLLKEKGVTGITGEILVELRRDLVRRAENLVNAHILKSIPPHALAAFDEVLDRGDSRDVQAFVARHVPNIEEVTAEALMEFRELYLGVGRESPERPRGIRIAGVSCSPTRLVAGGALQISFKISSDVSSSSEFWLGASAVDPAGRDHWSVAEDTRVRLTRGDKVHTRPLTLPRSVAAGHYTLIGAVWRGEISRPERSKRIATFTLARAFEVIRSS